MLNPKLVPLHKNLPEINDRKDINPTRKGLQPHHNPSFILFDKISEVIINVILLSLRPIPYQSKLSSRMQREARLLFW